MLEAPDGLFFSSTKTPEVREEHGENIDGDDARAIADGVSSDGAVVRNDVPFLLQLIGATPGHLFSNLLVGPMLALAAGVFDFEV